MEEAYPSMIGSMIETMIAVEVKRQLAELKCFV